MADPTQPKDGEGAEAIRAAVLAPMTAPEWVKEPWNGVFYAEMYARHALEECEAVDRLYDGDWGKKIAVWLQTGADINGPPQGSYHHICHALARAAIALSAPPATPVRGGGQGSSNASRAATRDHSLAATEAEPSAAGEP